MPGDQVYQIKAPQVVSEEFEGEVVIVNLETGKYYSTRQSGAWVWRRLMQGACVAQVVEEASSESETAIVSFVEQLCREGLLVARQPEETQEETGKAAAPADFPPPKLERYNDMQDILLLDPIHDVDESGWPQAVEPA